jgi:uncharacterized protein YeaO (DUF488 family)
MPVRTRRWNDPEQAGDGLRVLVCRYRPRAVRSADEPWHVWIPDLGPSRLLHAERYGRAGEVLQWEPYRVRYLSEMASQGKQIDELAQRVRAGETITLLCSQACVDEAKCHRTLLRGLIEKAVGR